MSSKIQLSSKGSIHERIDGSKFKAVNNRDKNFTRGKMKRRLAEVEASIERYLGELDTADRSAPPEDTPPQRQDRGAHRGDGPAKKARSPDASGTGPTTLADRP